MMSDLPGSLLFHTMDVPWSDGFIEGCNNKAKVLKRVCFGMRNFSDFRKRILFRHTKNHAGALHPDTTQLFPFCLYPNY